MSISNIINSTSASSAIDVIYGTTAAPSSKTTSTNTDTQSSAQPSTIVTLSTQGRQLSQTAGPAQTGTSQDQPVAGETAARETAESPKTQASEGESRSISAYA
jgi:hypothetical protein